GLDVGDEAGVVLAAQPRVDLEVGLGRGVLRSLDRLGGHGSCLSRHVVARRMSMRRGPVGGGGGGGGSSICATVIPRSASATTVLIRRQFARTPQWSSIPQAPAWTLHSVIPSGPSIASTTSIS